MTGLKVLAYYPIFIKPYKDENMSSLLVFVPDFKIYTESKSIDKTIDVAEEAIVTALLESKKFVRPSDVVEAHEKASEDADEICDYSQNSLLTFVEVDVTDYLQDFLSQIEKEIFGATEKEGSKDKSLCDSCANKIGNRCWSLYQYGEVKKYCKHYKWKDEE